MHDVEANWQLKMYAMMISYYTVTENRSLGLWSRLPTWIEQNSKEPQLFDPRRLKLYSLPSTRRWQDRRSPMAIDFRGIFPSVYGDGNL